MPLLPRCHLPTCLTSPSRAVLGGPLLTNQSHGSTHAIQRLLHVNPTFVCLDFTSYLPYDSFLLPRMHLVHFFLSEPNPTR
jgi:hypothetical protein